VVGKRLVRVTVTLPEELLVELDELVKRSFKSRSSAVAEAVRRLIDSMSFGAGRVVVGAVSYHYGDHHAAERLRELGHRYRDVIVSTLHFHLGEDKCMEVVVVKGDAKRVECYLNDLGKVKGVERLSMALSSSRELP
jgi:CopG family nickel-responsive transcriptional regulator